MSFQRVMPLHQLWSGEMQSVSVNGCCVLLVNLDGRLCAYRNRCAHQGVPLSEGRLQGEVLICGAHHWRYSALSGEGLNPRCARLTALPVRVDENAIWVDVSEGGT